MASNLETHNTAAEQTNPNLDRSNAKRAADCIDLTSDDEGDGPACSTPATKRPRTAEQVATKHATPQRKLPRIDVIKTATLISPKSPVPTPPPSTLHSASPTSPQQMFPGVTSPVYPSLPTPNATPEKPKQLHEHPEIAERYAAKTMDGIDHTNPKKFTLKPACWKSWKARDYANLAEHMRAQFDPFTFAEESGLSVDEVKHVFSALVCNPLYYAVEARRRGEAGMEDLMELYSMYGTPTRPWGKPVVVNGGKAYLQGELTRVSAGAVELILRKGDKHTMKLNELTEVDKKYLKDTLTKKDKKILWDTDDPVMDHKTGEMLL